jgi:opacity protein-like surface antigen
MKRSFTGALGALIIGAGIAPLGAADMASNARPVSTDPWAGFYLGADVAKVSGWVGGFDLGYNYRIDGLVLGAEGNFDWAGTENNFLCGAVELCSADPEWFATLVGRVGSTIGPALFYVNGGMAWSRETITNVFAGETYLGSQIRPGWTVGAGIEYLVSKNWSAKLEYDYMNFGERPVAVSDSLGNSLFEDVKQTMQLIKVGFNYRFNGWGLGADKPVMSYAQEKRATDADDDDSPKTIRATPSLSVGKDSVDAVVAGLFALTNDLEKSGPRLYLSEGVGWYQFGTTSGTVKGLYSTGDVLGGYGFVGKNYDINFLAGVSAENDILSAVDPSDPVHGTEGGIKVRSDFTINPTPKTLFEGEVDYTTAFKTYYSSAKVGYDIFGNEIFVGPQVIAFGDARFSQWRVGGAISQIKFGKAELDLSAGYARDSSVGSGAFVDLGVNIEF